MADKQTNPEVLSTSIVAQILEIGKAQGSVAARLGAVQAKGKTKLVFDEGTVAAEVIEEGDQPSATDFELQSVELDQKRMASAVEVSQDVQLNSAVPLEAHVTNVLAKRLVNGMEKQMFVGGDAVESVFGGKFAEVEGADHAGYVKAVGQLAAHADINAAIFVVTSIDELSELTDAQGNYLLTFNELPAGAVGRLLGVPVYVTPEFSAAAKAVLINPSQAYAVTISSPASVKKEKRTGVQELKGVDAYVGQLYVAGKVINKYAAVIVK